MLHTHTHILQNGWEAAHVQVGMVEIGPLQDTLGEIAAREVAEAKVGALEVDVS